MPNEIKQAMLEHLQIRNQAKLKYKESAEFNQNHLKVIKSRKWHHSKVEKLMKALSDDQLETLYYIYFQTSDYQHSVPQWPAKEQQQPFPGQNQPEEQFQSQPELCLSHTNWSYLKVWGSSRLPTSDRGCNASSISWPYHLSSLPKAIKIAVSRHSHVHISSEKPISHLWSKHHWSGLHLHCWPCSWTSFLSRSTQRWWWLYPTLTLLTSLWLQVCPSHPIAMISKTLT